MIVNLAGIVPLSTVDMRDKSAIVIFFSGCPFRCIYCQNYEYLEAQNPVELDFVKSHIDRAAEFVDGVVFTGGEPTMQKDSLKELLKYSYEKGLITEVQTNGWDYPAIKDLLSYLDIISMDVKAPLNAKRYGEICGIDERSAERTVENIKSILSIKEKKIEVKTTVYKEFVLGDFLEKIKEDLPKDIDWIIQRGNDERVPPSFNLTPLSDDEVKDIAKILSKDRKNVWIRTRAGDERIS
jgi:pyruvate formate lyase activating enzyme